MNNRQGRKDDKDKPMMDLVEPIFLEDLGKVMTMGAKKYGLENWKNNLEKRRILAALYRHVIAYHKGEIFDEESGLHHLTHAAINCMFLHWYDIVKEGSKNEKTA